MHHELTLEELLNPMSTGQLDNRVSVRFTVNDRKIHLCILKFPHIEPIGVSAI